MTSKLDIVRAYIDADGMEASAIYVDDDFQSVDKDGNVVMDRATYFAMGTMMYASFRGLKYVPADLREEGDTVIMTGHFQGTHIADLDLSAIGVGVIPASGKKIVWPDSSVRFTLADDKIVREEPFGESGGMEAFLAPLLGK